LILPATPTSIEQAVLLLRQGRLVAFPTETVYGLGADARNPDAVRRIFEAKGRPSTHPLIVHLAGEEQVADWARDVPSWARALAQRFWPGPLTLIVPRSERVPDAVTGGQDSVGLRMPAHPVARELLQGFGGGIAAPSANRFGRVSATTARHVDEEFGDEVALVLDGGPCRVGIESTIVDCTGDAARLLRPGGIAAEALAAVLGYHPLAASDNAPRASGTLASHYAPRTPTELQPAETLAARVAKLGARCGVIARTVQRPADFSGIWLAAPGDAESYAQGLYARLRELDQAGLPAIVVEAPPRTPEWLAVNDRLQRATHREGADRATQDR
jgi:L-threonylcarbamoyladenylate synthase